MRPSEIFLLGVVTFSLLIAGCNAILGLDEGQLAKNTGGAGGATQCAVDTDCNDDQPCTGDVCVNGSCINANLTDVPAAMNEVGDCMKNVCSDGVVTEFIDNDDEPQDTECGIFECLEGVLVPSNADTGMTCAIGGVCDGEGTCVECIGEADCTGLEPDDDCKTRVCVNNMCAHEFATNGTTVALQLPGDCQLAVCDGAGNELSQPDDLDIPDDLNPCTFGSCSGGVSMQNSQPGSTACGMGLQCNGAGTCVGCTAPGDCGSGGLCFDWQCNGSSECQQANLMNGMVVGTAGLNDCQQDECLDGIVVQGADNTDPPLDDGNQCTDQACASGAPLFPPSAFDTTCSQMTVGYCDGSGVCVECNSAGQCPISANDCVARACNANFCDFDNVPAGTPAQGQTAGNCKTAICDGQGMKTSVDEVGDPFIDGNECTTDTCVGIPLAPSNPPTSQGSSCMGGTMYCDGASTCVQCTDDMHCMLSVGKCINFVCDYSSSSSVAPVSGSSSSS
jgi:hypothetical protein